MLRVALVPRHCRQRHELITGRSNRNFQNQREDAALEVADRGRDILRRAFAPHLTIMLKSLFAQLRSKLCLAKDVAERLASEATPFFKKGYTSKAVFLRGYINK